ncbi:hypothetical protein [Pseudodesulfovibrio tunisiensis]|uniref:hypothetical protein n=1 Tax=Pseudodesulfovibrio tunisiensis TaxID=463192 RepID=UPI001FB46662|nr:hypothetical protein [Pseudodesulfovibrio tunisiensis]
MLYMDIWIPLFCLLGFLLILRALLNRKTVKVYRVSPASLRASRRVVMDVLPLVETGDDRSILDIRELPHTKENIKSAVKILAYYFGKHRQSRDLIRVKTCYLSLSRFQECGLPDEEREQLAEEEKVQLLREFDFFITQTPFGN